MANTKFTPTNCTNIQRISQPQVQVPNVAGQPPFIPSRPIYNTGPYRPATPGTVPTASPNPVGRPQPILDVGYGGRLQSPPPPVHPNAAPPQTPGQPSPAPAPPAPGPDVPGGTPQPTHVPAPSPGQPQPSPVPAPAPAQSPNPAPVPQQHPGPPPNPAAPTPGQPAAPAPAPVPYPGAAPGAYTPPSNGPPVQSTNGQVAANPSITPDTVYGRDPTLSQELANFMGNQAMRGADLHWWLNQTSRPGFSMYSPANFGQAIPQQARAIGAAASAAPNLALQHGITDAGQLLQGQIAREQEAQRLSQMGFQLSDLYATNDLRQQQQLLQVLMAMMGL